MKKSTGDNIMFQALRSIPLSLLTIGLLIGGLSEAAKAQPELPEIDMEELIGLGGGKATLGDTDDPDFDHSFSLFADLQGRESITRTCDSDEQGGVSSCLFEDVVSELAITLTTSSNKSEVTLGTDSSLGKPIRLASGVVEKNNDVPRVYDYILNLGPLNHLLNLRTEWDSDRNRILYRLTDSRDKNNPIILDFLRRDTLQPERNSEEPFPNDLGFQLLPPNDELLDGDMELRNNLVANPVFLLKTLKTANFVDGGEESIVTPPSGYFKYLTLRTLETGSRVTFKPISEDATDVPEPTSVAGLLLFTFLGIKLTKKQLL